MSKLILKYSTNNIFLTFIINNKKVYSKSTGQFLEYKKGKRKISNLALYFILNDFINFYILNFKNNKIENLFFEMCGCTIRRFSFLKKNLFKFILKINYKFFFFLDKNLIPFNGCRVKKKRRKRKKRKKVRIK